MASDELSLQLRRLVTGLADQEMLAGHAFVYDGGNLYADEIADLMLPSIVCLAQDLSLRLEMGSFGYRFELRGAVEDGLPLAMAREAGHPKLFLEVAPFVSEVFGGDVMRCCSDLARLFERAAQLVNPHYRLRNRPQGDSAG